MSKNKFPVPAYIERKIVEVKSKFDAEFRRFSLRRNEEPANFENFHTLIKELHGLTNIPFVIRYVDPHDQELLPINNDANFRTALKTAQPMLRVIVQREEDLEYGDCMKPRTNHFNIISMLGQTPGKPKVPPISMPHDFRQVSAIIDVDIVPESHRRVRLIKHGSDKPLGFYIRDGMSVRVTPNGLEKQPGIFISRLVSGGLAESTGLLAVNDEVIEVNGIEVAGKTLDQVTDMMVANSSNLIITFKPANQRTLASPRRGSFSRTSQLSSGSHHTNHTNTSDELEPDEQDEIVDMTGITLDDNITTTTIGLTTNTNLNTTTITTTTVTNNNNNNNNNNSNVNNNQHLQHSHSATHMNNSSVTGSTLVTSRDGVLHL